MLEKILRFWKTTAQKIRRYQFLEILLSSFFAALTLLNKNQNLK